MRLRDLTQIVLSSSHQPDVWNHERKEGLAVDLSLNLVLPRCMLSRCLCPLQKSATLNDPCWPWESSKNGYLTVLSKGNSCFSDDDYNNKELYWILASLRV